ncbi:MAG: dienelactone hydrolase family protein [Streptosporangiaceae bacterium]
MRTIIRKAATSAAIFAAAAAGGTAVPAHASPPAAAARVVVSDIRIAVPGQAAVPAFLVRPAGRLRQHSQAGILFLHWLGQIHSDRTEFLAEAIGLAERGAVSILPEGTFPWTVSPGGTARDVRRISRQLAAFRACLNKLFHAPSVDKSRVAVVGHDYGAMYGALLASSDHRVRAAVLATPDATWGHWFVKYWLGFKGKKAAAYDALFTRLQPVRHVSRLGRRELFQWAGSDIYVSAAVRREFALAAPHALVKLYQGADHQLTSAAETDRAQFLARQLHLQP